MLMSGIYGIANRADGRMYVGASRNIASRWFDHAMALHAGQHHNLGLQAAFNAGAPFAWIVLEQTTDLNREHYWLTVFESVFNIRPVNKSRTVRHPSWATVIESATAAAIAHHSR